MGGKVFSSGLGLRLLFWGRGKICFMRQLSSMRIRALGGRMVGGLGGLSVVAECRVTEGSLVVSIGMDAKGGILFTHV